MKDDDDDDDDDNDDDNDNNGDKNDDEIDDENDDDETLMIVTSRAQLLPSCLCVETNDSKSPCENLSLVPQCLRT